MKLFYQEVLIDVEEGAMLLCKRNFYMEDDKENPAYTKGAVYIVNDINCSPIDGEELLSLRDNAYAAHGMSEDLLREYFKWIGVINMESYLTIIGEEDG